MFTGLIEEIGTLKKIRAIDGGLKLLISCERVLNGLRIDDSVAVNGVCLTAVDIELSGFWADAVGETLTKTTLGKLAAGSKLNLERALRLNDRLGGHLVQGHVNGKGKLLKVTRRGEAYLLEFSLPRNLIKYCIPEGSIAIDGVSLTIAQLYQSSIAISVIPHTWINTNFSSLKVGDEVNIEADLIAKYVERLNNYNSRNSEFTIERLKEEGF